MKKPKAKDSGFADTLKGLGTRFALLFFVIVTLSMLVLGKSDPRLIERTQGVVIDDLAPVMSVLSEPVTAFHHALDWGENVAYVFRENDRLREENRRLQSWQALAQKLAQDNAQFRALLHVQPDQTTSVAVARVIADTGGSFVRSIIIDAGTSNGVAEGQPVLDQQGIAGRVITAGARSARVLLITDLNSRVPVKIAESGYNAILAGDNLPLPKIIFLPIGAVARVGDHVVTSGHGGIFPPDLAVGKIVSVAKSGEIRVMPAAELGRLNYVRLFSFEPLPVNPVATPATTDDSNPETTAPAKAAPLSHDGMATPKPGAAAPAPQNIAPQSAAPRNVEAAPGPKHVTPAAPASPVITGKTPAGNAPGHASPEALFPRSEIPGTTEYNPAVHKAAPSTSPHPQARPNPNARPDPNASPEPQ